MPESTLNFVDGDNRTLDWDLVDEPGIRYDVKPVVPQIAAEVSRSSVFLWLGNSVDNLFLYNFVQWDTDGMVNLGAHPDRITITTAGVYYVYGSLNAAQNGGPGSGDTMAFAELFLNGFQINSAIVSTYTLHTINFGLGLIVSTVLKLVPGDFVTMHGQASRNVTLQTTNPTPLLGCYRLGPLPV